MTGLIMLGALGMLLAMVFPDSVASGVGMASAGVVVACFGAMVYSDMKHRQGPGRGAGTGDEHKL